MDTYSKIRNELQPKFDEIFTTLRNEYEHRMNDTVSSKQKSLNQTWREKADTLQKELESLSSTYPLPSPSSQEIQFQAELKSLESTLREELEIKLYSEYEEKLLLKEKELKRPESTLGNDFFEHLENEKKIWETELRNKVLADLRESNMDECKYVISELEKEFKSEASERSKFEIAEVQANYAQKLEEALAESSDVDIFALKEKLKKEIKANLMSDIDLKIESSVDQEFKTSVENQFRAKIKDKIEKEVYREAEIKLRNECRYELEQVLKEKLNKLRLEYSLKQKHFEEQLKEKRYSNIEQHIKALVSEKETQLKTQLRNKLDLFKTRKEEDLEQKMNKFLEEKHQEFEEAMSELSIVREDIEYQIKTVSQTRYEELQRIQDQRKELEERIAELEHLTKASSPRSGMISIQGRPTEEVEESFRYPEEEEPQFEASPPISAPILTSPRRLLTNQDSYQALFGEKSPDFNTDIKSYYRRPS